MFLAVDLVVIYWDNWDRWRERFKLVVQVEREVMKGDEEEEMMMRMEMGDIGGGMMMTMADIRGGDDGS
jgi:hypothetical protein